MHELSLCRAVLKLVEPIARRHDAAVSRIVLRLGPLSGAEPDLLRRAFPIAAAGTCAAGALLEIESCPIRVRCLDCGSECAASINRLNCRVCGAVRTQLLSGDELDLKRVELEPEEARQVDV